MERIARACLAAGWAVTALLGALASVQAIDGRDEWPEPLTLGAREVPFVSAFTQLTFAAAAVWVAAWVCVRLIAQGRSDAATLPGRSAVGETRAASGKSMRKGRAE